MTTRCDILVVDDEPSIADVMSELLTDDGYTTRTAYSGARALHLVNEYSPKVLLLDLQMPEMTGQEVYKHLTELGKRADMRVIFMSAHPEVDQIALQLGADDFLSKPFEIETLETLLIRHEQGPPLAHAS